MRGVKADPDDACFCRHFRRAGHRPSTKVAGTCHQNQVDAALFDNLKQAVEFVAERGGGVVYTELAGTKFAESMTLPDNVELKPRRVEDEPAVQAA